MAKKILQQNHSFLEKAIDDNNQLNQAVKQLQSQLNQLNSQISRAKAEILKSLEPKIKKLICDNKTELEAKGRQLEILLQEKQDSFQTSLDQIELNNENELAELEEDSKLKQVRMKNTIKTREKELNDLYLKKLAKVPDKLETARKKARDEETIFRHEWETMISAKIRKDCHSDKEYHLLTKEEQEQYLVNVVSKLQLDIVEEGKDLQQKIEAEQREHSDFISHQVERQKSLLMEKANLRQKLEELDSQIDSLNSIISKCRCTEYKKIISQLEDQGTALESQIKNARSDISNISKIMNENKLVVAQINQTQAEIIAKKRLINEQNEQTKEIILKLEEKHKESIKALEVRVKQTISNKDARIKELTEKLKSMGFH